MKWNWSKFRKIVKEVANVGKYVAPQPIAEILSQVETIDKVVGDTVDKVKNIKKPPQANGR
mgnify:CR=1 FL=1